MRVYVCLCVYMRACMHVCGCTLFMSLLLGCVAKSGSSVVFFPAHTNGRVGSGELECKPEDICAILQYYHAVDK